jgi:hypothetical protein
VNEKKSKYCNYLIILILVSTLVRGLLAGLLELGNDEVYYRLYALYPDWSHFDHPAMVGWVIQLFSLNLFFQSEFFLRLGSVVFGAANIFIIYKIGKKIKNERTGFFAALLYVASIYATVITGIFILPDTPQNLFWLLSVLFIVKSIPENPVNAAAKRNVLLVGLFIGLAVLSKYTSVFLWFGAGLYILFFNRKWLKSPYLYLSAIITLLCLLPIFLWNYENHFISFTFQGGRVVSGGQIHFNYFITELLGEIFYNNPINFVLIVLSLVAFFSKKLDLDKNIVRVILLISLPLIFTFLAISLFRGTLPHWTAPAYTTLILLAAAWIDQKVKEGVVFPKSIVASLSLLAIILVLGFAQINYGIFKIDHSEKFIETGSNDPSLDLYGFNQVGKAFAKVVEEDRATGKMPEDAILVGNNWFPLANYDYYAASPLGMRTFGLGTLSQIHKYAWANRANDCFNIGMNAYFITDSRYFQDPETAFSKYFESIEPCDTVEIMRGGKVAKLAFIYRMKNMKALPDDPLFFY